MHKKDCFNLEKNVVLIYKFKRMVRKLNFSDQLTKIINDIKEWDRTWITCDSLHAWL